MKLEADVLICVLGLFGAGQHLCYCQKIIECTKIIWHRLQARDGSLEEQGP